MKSSKQRNRPKPHAPTKRAPRRWTAGLLAGALAALILGGMVIQLRTQTPEPPRVAVEGLEPTIAEQIRQTEQAVHDTPRSAENWGRLGMVYRMYGFNYQADPCFQEAIRQRPDDPRWHYFRGLLLQDVDADAALAGFRRAATLTPDEGNSPRFRLARLLVERGEYDAASQQYNRLLQFQPDHAPARLGLAQISFARGELEECATQLHPCLTNDFTRKAASTLLGMVRLRQGKAEEAEQWARTASALPYDAPWPDSFEEALLSPADTQRSLIDECNRLLGQRAFQHLMPLLHELNTRHPGAPEGWLIRGRVHLMHDQHEEALPALRRHLELKPDSVDGHLQLGLLESARDKNAAAAAAFRKVIELKPDTEQAHFHLGRILIRLAQFEEALSAFEQAIRHRPDYVEAYLVLAELHLQDGNLNETRTRLQQLRRIAPEDPRVKALEAKLNP